MHAMLPSLTLINTLSMRKYITLTFLALGLYFSGQAQTITDALNLSQTYPEGTARTLGVGGSLNALGADFSVLSSNPAGLAAYRRSEFIISPGMNAVYTDARLQGGNNPTTESTRNQFTLHNAGLVIASQPNSSEWATFNFGFGINRTANLTNRLSYGGNSPGSITDRFLELADGFDPDQLDNFEAGIAYETGAIYDSDGDFHYDSDFLLYNPDHNVFKEQLVNARGGITEMAFSLAGNYRERLFIGTTIAVPFVSYTEEKIYREMDDNDNSVPFFNALSFEENLATTGAGFQAKFGMIYRAAQALRFGFGLHTPAWFKLTDEYSTYMEYDFTDSEGRNRYESASPDGLFEYRVATPWRWNASMGLLLGRYGFLHFDAEWQDYRSARFNFLSSYSEDLAYERSLNRSIQDNYQSAFNLRGGGEIALNPFRLRAGIAFLGSPFAGDNSYTNEYTAGIGIRERNFFLDIGYRWQNRKEAYIPYFTANSDFDGDGIGDAPQQLVTSERVRHQFLMTFGFKF